MGKQDAELGVGKAGPPEVQTMEDLVDRTLAAPA